MSAITLSVIVITKNEARNIEDCLKSVAFADEWVVLDGGSSDNTCEIAQAFGARVVRSENWPGFGKQKNRVLAEARGDWVLSIDADERVSAELAASIGSAVQNAPAGASAVAAYELSRLSRFCGQWMLHGNWYPDHVLRLFRRESARFSDDLVHERLLPQGEVGRLNGHLLHETMPNLDDALGKMNRYTTGRAIDLVRRGKRGGLASAVSHAMWTFVRGYIFRRGFLDGHLGFVLAWYNAESTYYRYLKMWLLTREPNE